MLGGCFWDAWGSLGSLGGPFGPFGCLLGGPWASLEALGGSWDRPGGPLGVILEVWGDPWISPGRSECCYFVGFRWYSELSCFFMIFHRNLKVIIFFRKMKNYTVFTLILGCLNVAFSTVLGMFFEFHMFSHVRFL